MSNYPLIPIFHSRQTGESLQAFGLRAFSYSLNGLERLLDTDTVALALHCSQAIVTVSECDSRVRASYADTRLRLTLLLAERQLAESPAVKYLESLEPSKPTGGQRVKATCPVPVLSPTGGTADPF